MTKLFASILDRDAGGIREIVHVAVWTLLQCNLVHALLRLIETAVSFTMEEIAMLRRLTSTLEEALNPQAPAASSSAASSSDSSPRPMSEPAVLRSIHIVQVCMYVVCRDFILIAHLFQEEQDLVLVVGSAGAGAAQTARLAAEPRFRIGRGIAATKLCADAGVRELLQSELVRTLLTSEKELALVKVKWMGPPSARRTRRRSTEAVQRMTVSCKQSTATLCFTTSCCSLGCMIHTSWIFCWPLLGPASCQLRTMWSFNSRSIC